MNFLDGFSKKNTQISNVIKILPMGAELFLANGQTDMKLIVSFFSFPYVPKN